jgi:hypothetical protein
MFFSILSASFTGGSQKVTRSPIAKRITENILNRKFTTRYGGCTECALSSGAGMFFYGKNILFYDARVLRAAPHAVTRSQTVRYRYPLALKHATELATQLNLEWIMLVDDDTFVIPQHVDKLVMRTSNRTKFMGQKCTKFNGFTSFCGGAGWIARTKICRRLVSSLPMCSKKYDFETEYDRLFGRCLFQYLRVRPTWTKQLNSQPPAFYETISGRRDRPYPLCILKLSGKASIY